MADRRSVSFDDYKDPIVEDAQVGLKGTPETLNQLSSSADAAKKKRTAKAAAAIDAAVRKELLGDGGDSSPGDKDKGKESST